MKHLMLTTIAAAVLVGCGGESSYELLYHSITNAKIEAVEQHIADGADVNAKHDDEWRSLFWVSYKLPVMVVMIAPL